MIPTSVPPPPPPLFDASFIAELDKRLGQAEARINSTPASPHKADFLQDWPERVCNKWEQKTVNMERLIYFTLFVSYYSNKFQ
jgi:hypothetical protein